MELIIRTLVYILLVFIKIGDFVLFVVTTIAKLLLQICLIVINIVLFPFKILKNMFFRVKKEATVAHKKGALLTLAVGKELTKERKLPQKRFQVPLFYGGIPSFLFLNRFNKKISDKKKKDIFVANKLKKPKKIHTFQLPFLLKFRYFFVGFFFSTLFIFIPLVVFIFLQDIPNPKELLFRQIPQTTKIFDRNGILLYQIYASQNRTLVPLSDIPKTLQEATISIEDKDFYKHPGFDLVAIGRAMYSNFSGGDIQGGSTITQQLIKSALLTSEQTLLRKFKEVTIAFLAERIYTKPQILEMYFNQVPYGGTAWGAESASDKYFGKSVKDLDLAESSFLAGMPGAPTLYSPFGENKTIWKKRQKEVLTRMRVLGYISKDEEAKAETEELHFSTIQPPLRAPHFVLYVKDLLIKKYGIAAVERGGLSVTTSLDLNTQEMAQQIVSDEVTKNANLNLTNGASIITNPQNGDILAMVGSKNFDDEDGGNVNVTTALRQPGSSIKIITYSAALSRGYTAATLLDDSPITFVNPFGQSYSPVNYDGRSHGRVSLRLALGNSFNITAVRTINQIGVPTMVELAKKMGIKTWGLPTQYGVSITLGSAEVTMLDMTTVYGVLANGGVRVDTYPILKVTDYAGNILEEKSQDYWYTQGSTKQERVLDEGVAFIISDILADNSARVLEFGPDSPLQIPKRRVSVKTGTSDNKRDNWTIGYTPERLVAVWVGNNDGSPMSQTLASGITGAAPIWNRVMSNLLTATPSGAFKIPDDIVAKNCLGRTEYFIKGTETSVNCAPLPISPTPTKKP